MRHARDTKSGATTSQRRGKGAIEREKGDSRFVRDVEEVEERGVSKKKRGDRGRLMGSKELVPSS